MEQLKATAVRNVLWAIIFAAVFCLVMAAVSMKARAQSLCGSYQEIVFALEKTGEQQVSIGIVAGGESVMLGYAHPKTHTWTLIQIRKGGLACLISAGSDYETKAALFDPT